MKMPISSKMLAAVAIIMLVIGAGIGYGISAAMMPAPTTTTTPTTPTGLSGTIPIGVILPLSGDFASYGVRAKAALQVAEGEINSFMTASGSTVSFNFLIEDSTTTSSVTLTAVQSLAAKGVKVVIGGMDSGDLLAISQYVQSNQIVVISGESTAPRTSIGTGVDNGSYIFRDVPAGDAEGLSITQAFMSLGLKYVAAITAQRTYTEAIFNVFKTQYEQAGGTVVANVEYAPEPRTTRANLTPSNRQ